MSHKHSWTWKTHEKGYWIVCRSCGASDSQQPDEERANARVKRLMKATEADFTARLGLNRRMRKARAARRSFAP